VLLTVLGIHGKMMKIISVYCVMNHVKLVLLVEITDTVLHVTLHILNSMELVLTHVQMVTIATTMVVQTI
jgi:hypothetical protein